MGEMGVRRSKLRNFIISFLDRVGMCGRLGLMVRVLSLCCGATKGLPCYTSHLIGQGVG